jgi:chromosome segregation ATPase
VRAPHERAWHSATAAARVEDIAEDNGQRTTSGRFARDEADPTELSVGGTELLDRIERQAGELAEARTRAAELERALDEIRELGTKATKALRSERRLRKAAEASLERMTLERDELSAALTEERVAAERLSEELNAANIQAAMLDERMRTVWAETQGGEGERAPKRGLRRLVGGEG